MVELHQKYNLRHRNIASTTAPVKKILPRVETDQVVPKNTQKKTANI